MMAALQHILTGLGAAALVLVLGLCWANWRSKRDHKRYLENEKDHQREAETL